MGRGKVLQGTEDLNNILRTASQSAGSSGSVSSSIHSSKFNSSTICCTRSHCVATTEKATCYTLRVNQAKTK